MAQGSTSESHERRNWVWLPNILHYHTLPWIYSVYSKHYMQLFLKSSVSQQQICLSYKVKGYKLINYSKQNIWEFKSVLIGERLLSLYTIIDMRYVMATYSQLQMQHFTAKCLIHCTRATFSICL